MTAACDCEQLDLFAPEPEDGKTAEPVERERIYQMTELAGETWVDAFGGKA